MNAKVALCSLCLAVLGSSNLQSQSPSPSLSPAVPGPVTGTKITEAYARTVMRDAFFWAWPIINCYNKRLAFAQVPEPGLMNGALPTAPLNHLCMLTDYILPTERWVACPNQDVVYGGGGVALDISPVVFQVPGFGKRFWVYQAVICAPTASSISAPCMERGRAFIYLSDRTGKAKCQRASRRSSAPRLTAA